MFAARLTVCTAFSCLWNVCTCRPHQVSVGSAISVSGLAAHVFLKLFSGFVLKNSILIASLFLKDNFFLSFFFFFVSDISVSSREKEVQVLQHQQEEKVLH